jgi:hypothetical protein
LVGAGLLAVIVPAASAQGTHVFSPHLSLTGGCITSPADEVADPGLCPMPPGVPGVDHPLHSFSSPQAVSTDSWGNIYVASFGQVEKGKGGRIDVFDPSGFFITELPVSSGPQTIAVDDSGNLYVRNYEGELLLYEPTLYEPASGEIEYSETPKAITGPSSSATTAVAVNPLNQHVFVHEGDYIMEYGAAAEGNKVIEKIADPILFNGLGPGLAIDASRGRIYASDRTHTGNSLDDPALIRIFELEAPHKEIGVIDGSTTSAGKFLANFLSVAVDEATGNVFVYDNFGAEVIYEFSEDGEYLGQISRELQSEGTLGAQITIDNGKNSPNGALSPKGRFLFVPAFRSGTGHAFAFGPPEPCAATVESTTFTGVSETEAHLHAQVNPCELDTSYVIEYTTKASFEAEGFAGATVAKEGEIPAGGALVTVSAALTGLEPGTADRFRIVATNEKGADEAEGEFATYPEAEIEPCPNEAFRTGPSALLPDCRAYELVTPPDTNARSPLGVGHLGTYFTTLQASPAGEAVSFKIQGGMIPGFEATGSYAGDPYLSARTESGWETSYVGPTGAEAPSILQGSNSPDQTYSLWSTGTGEGSAAVEGDITRYVHYPDGHSTLVGRGSLGTDPQAEGKLISENGGHIVFVSQNFVGKTAVQLEPDAPPSGTQAIYDRTSNEVTHVVSLLPGNVTPAEGENAFFEGASLDGKGIVFRLGEGVPSGPLYLRYNDEETYEVAQEATLAGISEGGKRVFYLKGGNIFAFEAGGEEGSIQFTSSGDATLVNVAAEGRVAYFVSPSALPGGANPSGAEPLKGGENLYRSEEGSIVFVGTVTKRDVEGEFGGNEQVDGLGLWVEAGAQGFPGSLGIDPSRTTPDGHVLLFESRAALTSYDPQGHAEIYRYDVDGGELTCLSCNPTLAPATGQASIESVSQGPVAPEPFSAFAYVSNLRADGQRAFFQSTEALVPGDTDGLLDVYEWEARGVGSCQREGGCVYLISSGHSQRDDYLYAVSSSGSDAFFRSSDLLLPSDGEETPSVYDARIGGGFPEPVEEECQGEGCRPVLSAPPLVPGAESHVHGSSDVRLPKHCPKGKRKVTSNGRASCVKKKNHKHHRAGTKKKGAGK